MMSKSQIIDFVASVIESEHGLFPVRTREEVITAIVEKWNTDSDETWEEAVKYMESNTGPIEH